MTELSSIDALNEVRLQEASKKLNEMNWKVIPHHKKMDIVQLLGFRGIFDDEEWEFFLKILSLENADSETIYNLILSDYSLKGYFHTLRGMIQEYLKGGYRVESVTNFTFLDTFIFPLKLKLSGSHHFTMTDKIASILAFSDLASKSPASLFRLPYRTIFLQLTETSDLGLNINNPATGLHRIEGCYLCESHINRIPNFKKPLADSLGYDLDKPARVLEIFSIGQSKSEEALDDATHFIKLYIQDEERSALDIIDAHIDFYVNDHISENLTPLDRGESTLVRGILEQVIKSLVYINSDSTQKRKYHEYSDLIKKVAKAGPKKKGKYERQAQRTYDYTVIGPPGEFVNFQLGQSSGTSGRIAHWRRGHQRLQPYGDREMPKYKSIWIEPMMVGTGEIISKEKKVR